MVEQQPNYGVADLINICTQTYTSIINAQIIRIMELEVQVKNMEVLISSLSTKEHKLQKEIAELRGNDDNKDTDNKDTIEESPPRPSQTCQHNHQ